VAGPAKLRANYAAICETWTREVDAQHPIKEGVLRPPAALEAVRGAFARPRVAAL
jgi:hypothetical protein